MNFVLPVNPPSDDAQLSPLPAKADLQSLVPESLAAELAGLIQPAPTLAPEPMHKPMHNGGRPPKQLEAAKVWLQQFLRDGAKPSTEVKERGREYGFSVKTLERAKDDLQVRVTQRERQWFWEFPR